MLLNIRQLGLSSWVITLVAVALAFGGIALGVSGEGFQWTVFAVAMVILGLQLSGLRSRRLRVQRR